MIFLGAMTRHPEYAVHVHKLSWSIQMLDNIALDQFQRELPSWTESPAGSLQHTWKVLYVHFGVFLSPSVRSPELWTVFLEQLKDLRSRDMS